MKNLGSVLNKESRGDSLGSSVANFPNYNDKKYSIKKKFRNIIGVGLIGGMVLFGGCAGMNEYDAFGTILQYGAMSPNSRWTPDQKAGAAAIGGLMNKLGNRKNDRELAEKQRRESTANVITIPKYNYLDTYTTPKGISWIRQKDGTWVGMDKFMRILDIRVNDYQVTRASRLSGIPVIRRDN